MNPSHGLAPLTEERIRRVFRSHPDVEKAVLFGSRAKGTFKPGSDIDLALQGAALDERALNRLHEELDDLPIPHRVGLVIFSQITDPDFLAHIKRVGTVFYERSTG